MGSPNVKVVGSISSIRKALTYYRLFVCPMPYSAGLKGKIGNAIEAGIPIVATSTGVEGFPVEDGEECFVADRPSEFADKCNLCLKNPIIWEELSIKSRLMLADNLSPNVIVK